MPITAVSLSTFRFFQNTSGPLDRTKFTIDVNTILIESPEFPDSLNLSKMSRQCK